MQLAHSLAVVIRLRIAQRAFDRAQFGVAIEHVFDRGDIERRRLLRNGRDAPRGRQLAFPVVRMKLATQQAEEARFAAAVRTDESDAPTCVDLKIGALEKRARAAAQREMTKLDHAKLQVSLRRASKQGADD